MSRVAVSSLPILTHLVERIQEGLLLVKRQKIKGQAIKPAKHLARQLQPETLDLGNMTKTGPHQNFLF